MDEELFALLQIQNKQSFDDDQLTNHHQIIINHLMMICQLIQSNVRLCFFDLLFFL